MAAHGAQKALGWFDGPGPSAAAKHMESLGFRPGETYAQTASLNEIAGGTLIALGLGGPIGPALVISTMIVAQTTVHAQNGFFAQKNGIELGVAYTAATLAFASNDYGELSLDHALGLEEPLGHPVVRTLALIAAVAGAYVVLGSRNVLPAGPATPTFRGKNSPVSNGEAAPAMPSAN